MITKAQIEVIYWAVTQCLLMYPTAVAVLSGVNNHGLLLKVVRRKMVNFHQEGEGYKNSPNVSNYLCPQSETLEH